jgi:hypothetical protein
MTKRDITRLFIQKMEWANPESLVWLLGIKENAVRVMLSSMLKAKKPILRLKVIHNQAGNSAYSLHANQRDCIGSGNKFYHDCKLRNCLAKFLKDRNYEGLEELRIEKSADAVIGNLYFEFDNGSMDISQLEEKLKEHYSRDGKYQVIFFMRNRSDDISKPLEENRIKILFQAVQNVLRDKKGRVLAVGYLDYLNGGSIKNWKGE